MQLTTVLAFVGLASAAVVTTGCNANNCLRQVRGSSFPTRSGAADCSAYQTTTSTVFTTTTVTGNTNVTPTPSPTTPPTHTIPAYASGCSQNDASYRSACSCNGQTSTITTTTSTLTATTSSSPASPCSTFYLLGPSTGRYANQYFGIYNDGVQNNGIVFAPSGSQPQAFVLESQHFSPVGSPTEEFSVQSSGVAAAPIIVSSPQSSYFPLSCAVAGGTVSCTSGTFDTFYSDENADNMDFNVYFGNAADMDPNFFAFVPRAQAACS